MGMAIVLVTGNRRSHRGKEPNLHFSPPDGRSTRYDRQDFVVLA